MMQLIASVAETAPALRGHAIPAESPTKTPPGPIGNRWALLVGVDSYVDPAITPLRFCVNDILALEETLQTLGYVTVSLHDRAESERLLPTRDNIEAELVRLCEAAQANDLLWVHFTGHGMVAEGQPMLVAHNTRLAILARSALAARDVEQHMRNSAARRLVLTLDSCHAGLETKDIGRDLEFTRHVYDLAEGFALIAASTFEQVAHEWREKEHGVFTYYLLQGLDGAADHERKGFVTVDDLKTYTLDNLRRWSVQRGGQLQEPTARVEGLGDIILADYRNTTGDIDAASLGRLVAQADSAFAQMTIEEQTIARRIFLRLVQFGEYEPDTRRRQPVAALRSVQDAPGALERTLALLQEHGALIFSTAQGAAEEYVEPAQEGLITEWPALQEWLSTWRGPEATRRRLEARAAEWIRRGRGWRGLPDGAERRELRQYAAAVGYSAELSDFLQAGDRRAIAQLIGGGVATLLVIGALVLLGSTWARAMAVGQAKEQARAPLATFTAGPAVIGPEPGTADPVITPVLAAFGIEKVEVSNARYCLCYEYNGCSEPPRGAAVACTPAQAEYPVVSIRLAEANEFCRWIGRRLPTELEWERAARGPEGRPWPWGTGTPTAQQANMWTADGARPDRPDTVTSRTPGASPEGVLNLVGNVMEWTSSYKVAYRELRPEVWPTPLNLPGAGVVVRGGSWADQWGSISRRDSALPNIGDPLGTLGFRCAADAP